MELGQNARYFPSEMSRSVLPKGGQNTLLTVAVLDVGWIWVIRRVDRVSCEVSAQTLQQLIRDSAKSSVWLGWSWAGDEAWRPSSICTGGEDVVDHMLL